MSKFEVIQGVEGCCLALDDERIAGPKPWGGGYVIHAWGTERAYGDVTEKDTRIEELESLVRDMWLHLSDDMTEFPCCIPVCAELRARMAVLGLLEGDSE